MVLLLLLLPFRTERLSNLLKVTQPIHGEPGVFLSTPPLCCLQRKGSHRELDGHSECVLSTLDKSPPNNLQAPRVDRQEEGRRVIKHLCGLLFVRRFHTCCNLTTIPQRKLRPSEEGLGPLQLPRAGAHPGFWGCFSLPLALAGTGGLLAPLCSKGCGCLWLPQAMGVQMPMSNKPVPFQPWVPGPQDLTLWRLTDGEGGAGGKASCF